MMKLVQAWEFDNPDGDFRVPKARWVPSKYPVRLNIDSIVRVRDVELDGKMLLEVRYACGAACIDIVVGGTYDELMS